MRRRIGLSIMALETRREAILALAAEGDRLGYDGFFLPETWSYDTTVLLAEVAGRTNRIAIGTGIVGIWNRSAATVAMAAATLHAMSAGRFILGLGASTPQLAEGLHDTPFERPVRRMRRMIIQIRALLRGDRVPLTAPATARALKLNVRPAPTLPIHVASLGDAMTRLAGELADAWAPSIYPWSQLSCGVEHLRAGAARGGHPDRLPEIHPVVPAVVAETEAKAREGAAWFVSFYLTAMGTVYRDSLTRQGYGKAVDAVLAANSPKFTAVVPVEAEDLLEQLTVFGTPEQGRRRLERWYTAGAAFPVLLLRPGLTADECAFTLDAFRPMLQSASAASQGGRSIATGNEDPRPHDPLCISGAEPDSGSAHSI
jgi:alkanesulfonate monooxygenase SsuD/methylene tetrahydromethanopterin reductase-like flavin-dependent oxidoreductase (luciferase family)